MEFIKINLDSHKDIVIKFRRDSFKESFGHDEDFDEEEYIEWLEKKIHELPDGFQLIEKENEYIGQVELTVKKYQDKDVGYINLYYLTASYRGRGYAEEMHRYALSYFKSLGLDEYQLRVSPSNIRAMKFYLKKGMEQVSEEEGGKVIRMRGYL